MSKFNTTGNQILFDAEKAARNLSEVCNLLERLEDVINFELFRSRLEAAIANHNTKSNAGVRQYDDVMMFKVMVLCQYYNHGYQQTESQIIERSRFKQYLEAANGDKVPYTNTIHNFIEGLKEKVLREKLIQDFVDNLLQKGFILNEGQIMDASFVLAPRHRNAREENKKKKDVQWTFDIVVENEGGDELWNDKSNKKRKKRHRCQLDAERRRGLFCLQG